LIRDFSWKVGGETGEGIDSTGEIFGATLNNIGYFTYAFRHFPSRIRGGHTNYKIRISPEQIRSGGDTLDMLIAFDQNSIDHNYDELVEGGAVVYDSSSFEAELPDEDKDVECFGVPLTAIAKDHGMAIMKNVVAVGVSAGLLGVDTDAFVPAIESRWGSKGQKVVDLNLEALNAGADYCLDNFGQIRELPPAETDERNYFMTGNEALAFGALVGGCRVLCAYPITPASEIMEWLIPKMPDYGGVVVQAEDELAAINGVIGAAFSGARAMTSTSGPGLSLMMEALGLAGMTETPIVITDVQRAGPSTGMPTKLEQSDINEAVFGSHGEIPRIVIAPATMEDCFYLAAESFNLAEKYQCPVIVTTDLALGMGKSSVEHFDLDRIEIDRGSLLSDEELDALDDYKRYELTESGVSPRAVPGHPNAIHQARGVEHDEYGYRTEDPEMRTQMMNKRLQKLEPVRDVDWAVDYAGPDNPELLLVGYGSTYGPIDEAMVHLCEDGLDVGHLHVKLLEPLPLEQLNKHFSAAGRVMVVEHNAQGQLANLLRMKAGFSDELLGFRKYDGTPFLPEEIHERAKEVL
jgi:2-oxoglutarate ferredoxin oxidoreductase subunit alpha